MHTTLYRKWRPIDFSSVYGQKHITDVLRYEIQNGKTTHAYLFCGSRGTGKTTCAKILAKAVNCQSPVDGNPCGKCSSCIAIENGSATDIIEMDAASNNGVDYIRDIRDEVVYSPAVLKKRVYIVDEVHMLSTSAFNALLKTLEEPPEHVVFILATTELQKLPATITSRCQRFDFKRISADDIAKRLEFIASKEGISLTHEAAKLIGRLSQGGMRDSISLLELCSGTGKSVDTVLVNSTAGVTGRSTVSGIVRSVYKKDYSAIFSTISDFTSSSIDIAVFWQELIAYYRDMLVIQSVKDAKPYLDLTDDEYAETSDTAALFSRERLMYHIRLLEDAYITMQRGNSLRRICAEMTLVRMSEQQLDDSTDAILSRISALEEKLASGNIASILRANSANDNAVIPKHDSIKSGSAAEITDNNKSQNDISTTEMKPLQWAEIVESVERTDPASASMLKQGMGYLCGSDVIVYVGEDFYIMFLDNDDVKSKIASAVNAGGDTEGILPSGIKFIVNKSELHDDDPLSSLGQ